MSHLRGSLLLAVALSAFLFLGSVAWAGINPWVASSVYNPKKWDTSGPYTATPWLHPPLHAPNEGWGMLEGAPAFRSGRWRQFSTFTGSWGGTRDDLRERGIAGSVAYLGQLAANPVGGERQGTTWRGDLGAAVFLDLQRVAGWDRSYFTASFSYKDGTDSLSDDFIDNLFPVQLDSGDDGGATRLVHLAFGKQLFDNDAELVLGRLITGEDFASLRLACTSLNQAICANPIAAGPSISFPTYPFAVWGGRFKVKPGTGWYAQVGSYLVYPDFRNPDDHGTEFSAPEGSGALTLAEFGAITGSYRGQPGLPGKYKLGGYYDSEELEDLETKNPVSGTWGVYGLAEQMLLTEGQNYKEGLSSFLALSYAPSNRNLIEFMAAGGLSYQGIISGRPDDALAFIVSYGQFSNHLRRGQRARGEPLQHFELLIELNYRISIAPWLFVQPDIQGIIQPDGRSDIDDALAIGFAIGFVL